MSKKALLVITDGSEEMELTITCDVLRRGNIDVVVAGLDGADPVVCRSNLLVKPDKSFDDAIASGPFDIIILPGGAKGAATFCKSDKLGQLLKDQENQNKLIAAICAAPTAIKSHGICVGKRMTSYPVFKNEIEEGNLYSYSEEEVVVDGNLITSRGPGTAFSFSLKLIEILIGKEIAENVKAQLLL